jgi:hypothetical protein
MTASGTLRVMMRQRTAALRDFSFLYVRFGSSATKAGEA